MSRAQKSGVIVYSENIKGLADFYCEMFGMGIRIESEELVSIGNEEFSIVVHVPPFEIPEHNINSVKMFLTVESHAEAREKVVRLGGKALEGEWSNPLFKICNIADPEGNHIQIREFKL